MSMTRVLAGAAAAHLLPIGELHLQFRVIVQVLPFRLIVILHLLFVLVVEVGLEAVQESGEVEGLEGALASVVEVSGSLL